MKAGTEAARARETRIVELAAEARYARERVDLYRAKVYGPLITNPQRMRHLERARDLADMRLRLAQTAPGAATTSLAGR